MRACEAARGSFSVDRLGKLVLEFHASESDMVGKVRDTPGSTRFEQGLNVVCTSGRGSILDHMMRAANQALANMERALSGDHSKHFAVLDRGDLYGIIQSRTDKVNDWRLQMCRQLLDATPRRGLSFVRCYEGAMQQHRMVRSRRFRAHCDA